MSARQKSQRKIASGFRRDFQCNHAGCGTNLLISVEKMKKLPRGALGWAFYDWANSAFVLNVSTVFFALHFRNYWSSARHSQWQPPV
jgi:hypothetical protein